MVPNFSHIPCLSWITGDGNSFNIWESASDEVLGSCWMKLVVSSQKCSVGKHGRRDREPFFSKERKGASSRAISVMDNRLVSRSMGLCMLSQPAVFDDMRQLLSPCHHVPPAVESCSPCSIYKEDMVSREALVDSHAIQAERIKKSVRDTTHSRLTKSFDQLDKISNSTIGLYDHLGHPFSLEETLRVIILFTGLSEMTFEAFLYERLDYSWLEHLHS